MIGLDTNVIVRYLTQDDAVQTPLTSRLFQSFTQEEPGYVSIVALVETIWVLRSFYNASRQDIQRVVEKLLRSRGIRVERSDLVWMALDAFSQGNADFADYLIERSCHVAGCDHTFTFDRDAANIPGMKMLR